MAAFYLFFFVIVLLIVLYTYFTWTFDYWKRRNVPFEPPTVFVGNMTFALHESMATYMERLYRKFEGHDYFGIWLFRTPILIIRSPKMVKEVLVTNFHSFTNRAMETHESDRLGAKCLPIIRDEQWARLRQKLSPALTKAKIRNILTTRVPAISKEFQELIDREHVNKPVEMKNLFMKYFVEVIAVTIFGIRANSMQDSKAPMLKLGLSFVNWTLFRGMEVMTIFLFPGLAKLFRSKFFTKENNDFIWALFRKIFATREEEKPDLKAQPRDLVDALVKMKDTNSGKDFTEEEIVAQAALFFFAAFETTSLAMTFMCYELAFNQEFQEILHKEIKTLKGDKTEIDLDDLDGLKLLDTSIKETLRKYPILPFSDRLCGENCKLSDGLVVEKGIRVLVCTAGLHHDENYFPDPYRWDPYRFEKEDEMTPYTFLPFSEGQRICMGVKYAMLSMKMTISALVERYRFEPTANTIPSKDMRMNPYSVMTSPNGPIILNISRR